MNIINKTDQKMNSSKLTFKKLLMIALLVTVSAMEIVSPSGVMANVVSSDNQPAQAIYWSTQTTIVRAGLDGSNATTIVTGLTNVWEISVDNDAGKIYWVDADVGTIQRANLDGSEVEDVVTGLSKPFGLALDLDNEMIYWTDAPFVARRRGINANVGLNQGKIQRANLDGSQIEDLVTNLGEPTSIAISTKAGKVFWTELSSPGSVKSANLDGSSVETVATGVGLVMGVAVDSENEKVYWATSFTRVERANFDGTEKERLIDGGRRTGVAGSISLDLASNKMYFLHIGPDSNGNLTVNTIHQANLDGTEDRVIVSDPGSVSGSALGF